MNSQNPIGRVDVLSSMVLETNHLTKRYGGLIALDDVSLEFPTGQVTAIVGPNGAGKTTLFNTIAGFLRPDFGSVNLVDGVGTKKIQLSGLTPCQIASGGIGVLFQDVRVFSRLTALENVAVGFSKQFGENPLLSVLRPKAVFKSDQRKLAKAREILDFVGLGDKSHLWAGSLSYGQQKLVALARLIAMDCEVIMLDEPTSGIHPAMIETLLSLIDKLAHQRGKTIIMVEHNLDVVRRIGDWVYMMLRGKLEAFGKPNEVLRDASLSQGIASE